MERRGSRLSRRQFVLGAGGLGLVAGCGRLPGPGQPPAKMARMGYLDAKSPTSMASQSQTKALQQGLLDLGYVERQTLTIEWRFGEDRLDRVPSLAAELVQLPVDLIVAVGSGESRAAKNTTSTIPIVMGLGNDPVGNGLVASLARPGGNVTGLSTLAADLTGKRLELLKEAVPGASPVVFLWNGALTDRAADLAIAERAAQALGLELQSLDVRELADFQPAFEAAERQGAHALLLQNNFLTNTYEAQLAELAIRSRLPTMSGYSEVSVQARLETGACGTSGDAVYRRL